MCTCISNMFCTEFQNFKLMRTSYQMSEVQCVIQFNCTVEYMYTAPTVPLVAYINTIVNFMDPTVLLDKMYYIAWFNCTTEHICSQLLLVVLHVYISQTQKAATQLKKGKGGMNGPIICN